MLCGDLENVKMTQIKFLELKYPVSEIKNTLNYITNRLYALQNKKISTF